MISIRILASDIRGAKRDSWDHCPLARALRRTHPDSGAQVFDEHIIFRGRAIQHSPDTHRFTAAWNDGPVRPQTLLMPDLDR